MEHGPESTPQKSRLQELSELIADAAVRVEREFARTENSWLACFGNSVFLIETHLSSQHLRTLISAEEYQRARERLELLKTEVNSLKERFPSRDTTPPEDLKHALLTALDVLRADTSA